MKLYLLRHAPALSRDEWNGPDSARPLSEGGLVVAKDVAEKIAKLHLGLGVILTSPFERALRTAFIVSDVLGDVTPLVREPRLEPGRFSADSLAGMLEPYRHAPAVMVVGHEPSMTEVLEELLGGGVYSLKKGGLVRVDLEPDGPANAVLKWFAPPRLLRCED